jgi:hypothetical protein
LYRLFSLANGRLAEGVEIDKFSQYWGSDIWETSISFWDLLDSALQKSCAILPRWQQSRQTGVLGSKFELLAQALN